jgi:hypothetical protein
MLQRAVQVWNSNMHVNKILHVAECYRNCRIVDVAGGVICRGVCADKGVMVCKLTGAGFPTLRLVVADW